MLSPGQTLGENYRILEIQMGGMGEVYICELLANYASDSDKVTSGQPTRLALKTFQRRYFFDSATRLAFVREATTWLRLSGLTHILPVLGTEQIGDRPFLRMLEVPRGSMGERTLADLIMRGPLDLETVLGYSFQIALAMRSARNRIDGLIHGDLKPENVMLINGAAHLADFGMAFSPSLGRPDDRLESTWAYRAPELWEGGSRELSVASDVYAFGALLFEMLVGQTPFREDLADRDAWSAAHWNKEPVIPTGYPVQGLPAELIVLASACLRKDPVARPRDFDFILKRVNEISQEYDPVGLLMRMLKARDLTVYLGDISKLMFRERINGLLNINEPQQALAELEALDETEYDAVLWLRRGTALSLIGRDDEARDCIERAIDEGLPPEEQLNGQIEYALALKRLKLFDDAAAILEELRLAVDDQQLPIVIINLATVYLEMHHWNEAVHLLEPFVKKMPQWAEAWANLGVAYAELHRYKDAEQAYGRGLALAPHEGRIRVRLAELYMDNMGMIEEAWQALDRAFDSGYESRDWLVRMLVASLLLDRRDTLTGLLIGLKNSFEQSYADAVLADAYQMHKELYEKYDGEEGERNVESSEEGENTGPSQTAIGAKGVDDRNHAPQLRSGNQVANKQAAEQARPSLPFLNFRYYDFFDFTLDYYQAPEAADYFEQFIREYRRALRDPRFTVGGASLRGSPFYFAQCPNCDVHVLTNRDIGKSISCRICGQSWQAVPITGRMFDEIRKRVSEEIGIREVTGEDVIHGLMIQAPVGKEDERIISQICEREGLSRLGEDDLLATWMLMEFSKRDINMRRSWSAWVVQEKDNIWVDGTTPRKIGTVVRKLQTYVPGVVTMSTTLLLENAVAIGMGKKLNQLWIQIEEESRAAIREGRAEASHYLALAKALMLHGKLGEAEQFVRAAVAVDEGSGESWEILGEVLLKRNEFDGAREALEKALELNPKSVTAHLLLAKCYRELGDEDSSHKYRIRARSLTGGEILFDLPGW
jgi:serine/threonine protein kinase